MSFIVICINTFKSEHRSNYKCQIITTFAENLEKYSDMEKLNTCDINLHIKMRFIGYYMKDDQFMRTETIFPEQAEELACLLKQTFETFVNSKYVDDDMKLVLDGNTVFILKGEDGRLYGYYPRYNIARLTGVHYVRPEVNQMPEKYKRWFYPGDHFIIYK
jgi:hypothetical protein